MFFGGRTIEKDQAVAKLAQNNTRGGTKDAAASFGEILLLTA